MQHEHFDGVAALERRVTVEIADTPDALRDAQRLRHQVFCLERQILPGPARAGVEADEYDSTSHHVLLRHRDTGAAIGTARLVVPVRLPGAGTGAAAAARLPMLRYCPPEILSALPMGSTGEISRFALSKTYRDAGGGCDRLLRFALMRGILGISLDLGLTHWCALMEPSLMRLLRAAGIGFAPLGPLVQAFGLRQPCVAPIGNVLVEGSRRCPDLYRFVAGRRAMAAEGMLSAA